MDLLPAMPMRFPLSPTERITTIVAIVVIVLGAVGILAWKEVVPALPQKMQPASSPRITLTDNLSKNVIKIVSNSQPIISGPITSINTAQQQFVLQGVSQGQPVGFAININSSTLLIVPGKTSATPYAVYHFDSFVVGQNVTVYGTLNDHQSVLASLVIADPLLPNLPTVKFQATSSTKAVP